MELHQQLLSCSGNVEATVISKGDQHAQMNPIVDIMLVEYSKNVHMSLCNT